MAGRPKGSKDSKLRLTAARVLAAAALADGITPLEVMLLAMRRHVDRGDLDAAADIAKHAAPYVHARLAAVQYSGPDGDPIPLRVEYSWADAPAPSQTSNE